MGPFTLRRRYAVAALLVVGCALWFTSGILISRNTSQGPVFDGRADICSLIDVLEFDAAVHEVKRVFSANVVAARSVDVISEANGRVEEVLLSNGSAVDKDQVILRIDARGKLERLEQARVLLEQRRLERGVSESLGAEGYRSQVHDHAALVALREAEVNYKNAKLALDSATVKAPFVGVVDEILPQVGSMVSVGQTVARVLNFDNLKVVTYVPERDVAYIKPGDSVKVKLGRIGVVSSGKVSFVSKVVSPETKSYKLEILIEPQGVFEITEGMFAQVEFVIRREKAYRIPSSSLSVSAKGNLGVKVLDDRGLIRVLDVSTVDDDEGYIWVSGIHEDSVKLIVRGHEYALDGAQIVECNT
ncbi:efflux RND transporter periplasmic adaptor subunit [Anaplasma phagocytophilum]|uniref:efflux RND transporter periplasmic adaptor subunit n=1 Tax=Anaplasma phagocytophilum TaxID=948 RepID=UPI00200D8DB0|nr:efflux RND transporter periplasmic adaptor subunit [Anaplasma phagocytophilum]UQD53979.1 efflux RND transporter periplasmic adaptor subunit [Anaplasma phagocytophilum]